MHKLTTEMAEGQVGRKGLLGAACRRLALLALTEHPRYIGSEYEWDCCEVNKIHVSKYQNTP